MCEDYNAFPGDTYDTPENYPRSLWDIVTFRSRWSFYLRNFFVFMQTGWYAKHTDFPGEIQTKYSLKNLRIAESCGGKVHIRGLNNIRKAGGPVVIIGNHMSLLETAVLHAFVRPRLSFCFVIKEALLHVPFFGDIMRKLQCIAVGRENPREDFKIVMQEGKKALAEGKSVIIFPQHSRTAVFDESQFNTIGVKLAKQAGVPVLPLALRTDFLENGKKFKDLGPVHRDRPIWFEFGEPFEVTGSGKEEQQKLVDFIKSRLLQWGCEVRENRTEEE